MSTFTEYPSPKRSRRRAKRSSSLPLILALVTLAVLPLLGFVAWKLLNKPVKEVEVVEYRKVEPKAPTPEEVAKAKAKAERKERERAAAAQQARQQPRQVQQMDVSPTGRALNVAGAVSQVGGTFSEAIGLGKKVLVIWLFDRSPGATPLRQETIASMDRLYDKLKAGPDEKAAGDDGRVLSVVASFGSDVNFVLDKPTSDVSAVRAAADGIRPAETDMSNTFTAVQATLDKYLDFRKKQRYVRIIVVSDAAGDDEAEIDPLLPNLEKFSIPVDCIGQEAPFADVPVMGHHFSATEEKPKPVRHRTDSRFPEWIHLDYPTGRDDSITSVETELGPYSMERLCKAAGGVYFALPKGMRGYGGGTTLPRAYAPEYVSEKVNEQQVQHNKAKKALVEAAKLPQAESLRSPDASFANDDDVKRVRALDSAQKPAAKIMPGLEQLYNTLKAGEGDEPKLAGEPRWRAAYDLALGRAMAAKARCEGYIAMLAVLKGGKKFKDPAHNFWILEASDEPTGNSPVDKMASKARDYLSRVQKEHPNTPWAMAADRELQQPIGWKWGER